MHLTSSMEDYLKTIFILYRKQGYARCVDISEYMGVTMPSVSRAVKELIKAEYLMKEVNGTLSLTGIVKKTAHPTNSLRQPAPDFAPTVRACAAEEGFPHWLYCVGGGYSRSRSIGRSFAEPAPAA